MNIYVGNLSRDVTEADLRQAFEAFGKVVSVSMVRDRRGQPKGFAFVEMSSREEGLAAIEELKGKSLNGRIMDVVEASPPPGKGKRGGAFRGGRRRRR